MNGDSHFESTPQRILKLLFLGELKSTPSKNCHRHFIRILPSLSWSQSRITLWWNRRMTLGIWESCLCERDRNRLRLLQQIRETGFKLSCWVWQRTRLAILKDGWLCFWGTAKRFTSRLFLNPSSRIILILVRKSR